MKLSAMPEPPPVPELSRMSDLVPVEDRPDASVKRGEAIAAMVGVMRQEQLSLRRRRRAAQALAAAVVVLGAGVGFWKWGHASSNGAAAFAEGASSVELRVVSGTATTRHAATAERRSAGASVAIGRDDRVVCGADCRAVLSLPRGVRAVVDGNTEASIAKALENEQRIELDSGSAEFSIPHPGGPVFSVVTPDAEVIVHGTEFRVAVERNAANATTTSVKVTRGSVLVISGADHRLLETGDTWSSRKDSPPPANTSSPSAASTEEDGRESALRVPRRAPMQDGLTEQNRLFQAFLDARHAHDDARAVHYLDELLKRYPRSPLADQARTARVRTLEDSSGNGSGR